MKPVVHIVLALLLSTSLFGQERLQRDTVLNKKRLALVVGSQSGMTIGAAAGLYQLWYKPYGLTSFHWFDDSDEWLQIDKFGHTLSAYIVGTGGYEMMKWAGVSEKSAIWWGATAGLWIQTSIEIMDGHSVGWGASWADLATNKLGTGLFISQQLAWGEQRFRLKFSSHLTPYAQYRPELMGSTTVERWMKDYNGQTHWLSFSPARFVDCQRWPEWLMLSIGYSADGMTGGSENVLVNDAGEPIPYFTRGRQMYLSMDVDLQALNVKSPILKSLFNTIGWFKVPAPAIEFNQKHGVRFRPLYY